MNYCPSTIHSAWDLILNFNEAGEFYLAMVTHGCLVATVALV
jgi:hypothetical protein